jgi:hypothetical protein
MRGALRSLTWFRALVALPFVFRFRLSDRLPLHVAWIIHAAAGKRLHVVDHVAGALPRRASSRWAWVQLLELVTGSRASVDIGFSRSADSQHAR